MKFQFKNILPIILFLVVQNYLFGQDWEGYGKGVSFITIKDIYVSGRTCVSELNLKLEGPLDEGKNLAYLYDEDTGENKFSVILKSYGTLPDSIIIETKDGRQISSFYNEDNYKIDRKFQFYGMELEFWNHESDALEIVQINKKGIFRISNENLETKLKRNLTDDEWKKLLVLVSTIDVMNLNDCQGGHIGVEWSTWTYTFYDWDRYRYNFKTHWVPSRLIPLTDFIRSLK